MTSNGKQFTITCEMLTAVARDQRWPDVVAGILVRFSKFAFVWGTVNLFPWNLNVEGRFSGNKIHCSSQDQSLYT